MSGKVVGWAMEQKTGSSSAKLVLVKLADNANEEGRCWPSIDLIVKHTELARSSVYKQLKHLRALTLVREFDRVDGNGKGYQLLIPASLGIPPHGNRLL